MKFPILLPNIFNHPFTYESDIELKIGDFVEVPFGKSKKIGVVWDNFEKNNNKNFKIKKIIRKLQIPNLKKKNIRFFELVFRIQSCSKRNGFKAYFIKWKSY